MARAAFPILDAIESEDWDQRNAGTSPGDAVRATTTADWMARVLSACERDPSIVPLVVEGWAEDRGLRFESQGKGHRAVHVKALHLRLGITSYGNLFGRTDDLSPGFDAHEVAEGRSRGWRR